MSHSTRCVTPQCHTVIFIYNPQSPLVSELTAAILRCRRTPTLEEAPTNALARMCGGDPVTSPSRDPPLPVLSSRPNRLIAEDRKTVV